MREILFRGKLVDNGKWVEGLLMFKTEIRVFTTHKWYDEGEEGEYDTTEDLRVVPETVGQYTGLKDKNGKKIFEGDIVEFTDKYTRKKGRAEIVFEAFKWKYSGCYYGGNPIVWLCIDDGSIEFEIIGNIHDNPELLKGGDGL